MKNTPTPRKHHSQRCSKVSPLTNSASISDDSKNSQRVAKKNLNVVFSSLSEDLLNDSVTETFNFSPISEVLSGSNVNYNGESSESFEHLIVEEEVLTSSDSSATSLITTVNDDSLIKTSEHGKIFTPDSNVEAEVMSNLLKQARVEVSSSNDVSPGSKKLLDSLVEVTVTEFGALPNEKEPFGAMEKTLLWLIAIMLILIGFHCFCGGGTLSSDLPPT